MDFEKIKELIKLVDSSSLAFFELESGNDHIKMDKSLNRGLTDNKVSSLSNMSSENNLINTTLNSTTSIEKEDTYTAKEELNNVETQIVMDDKNVKVITSPMVGTFYSSASPESSDFVAVGDKISKGKVICIIEAMKLMNEIESDYSGIIIERLINSGDMVEYGQPLFKVKGE